MKLPIVKLLSWCCVLVLSALTNCPQCAKFIFPIKLLKAQFCCILRILRRLLLAWRVLQLTNQPHGEKARVQKPSWKGVRDDMNDDESFWLFINSSSRFYHHYGSSIICVDSFFLDSKNAFFNSSVLSIPKCGCRETCKIGLHYSFL